MCKYCEKGKKIEEVENDNIYFEIYGKHLRVIGKVLSIPLGRDVIIEYCPMCRKEARRVNKEEIVQRLKFVADEIDKDIKIFEETHNFEHIYDYNVYSIKEFIDEFINIMNTMKEVPSNDK